MTDLEYLKDNYNYNPDSGVFTYKKINKRSRFSVGDVAGYKRHDGYILIAVNKRQRLAHRMAWLIEHGSLPDAQMDHRDVNPSNNSISNLRLADNSLNGMNVGIKKNNSSGVKGVSWDKTRSLWMARVQINGKQINLGRFSCMEQAKLVACEARERLHKEFCNHG